ncbi:MAG TPA: hypothetical protein VK722_20625 [Candidatus Aquilonibacter sp.]|jgi:hypothetical protein|nr:hypothetical protein [Candidatus Aquilonibacter sp.]
MTFRTTTFCKSLLLLISLSMIAALVACGGSSSKSGGGGSGTTTPSVSLTTVPTTTPTSLTVGGTLSLTATITNDTSGVNWSAACGSTAAGACGTFSANNTASGIAVTYTAPATVPSSTVVITATVADDSSISASTSAITITAAVSGITVTLSTPPPSSLAPSGTATIAATTNDTAGVNWSCTPTATCGSFTPTSTLTTVTTVFTAGTTVGSVVVTATSVSEPTQSASANVNITSAASGTLTPGNYVFSLSGQDANSFYTVAGAFTVASSGVISGGEQDFSDYNNYFHDTIAASSYALSTDGNLLITLNTGDTNIGVGGVETLDAALVSNQKALITEFDSSASSSGELDLQAASLTGPSGGYAFFLAGIDVNGDPVINLGGVINVDSAGGISGTGSVFDMNDVGNLSADQSFTASTVSTTPDSYGLVTFTLNSAAFNSPGIVLTGYMVDSSHIRLVENWEADNLEATTGGIALGQTGTGSFSNTSVSGSTFVYGATGEDANGSLQEAGLLTFNADGSVSGNLSFNDFASQSPQGGSTLAAGTTTIGNATYTVDTTGRVTVTGVTDSLTSPTFQYTLQLYLDGNGNALLISMDTTDGIAGSAFPQTGSFTAASFAGSYALNVDQQDTSSGFEYDGVGVATSDGVSSVTGYLDMTGILSSSLTQDADDLIAGGFTANANGVFTGTIQGISTNSGSTADNFTYYLVDTTKAVAIENDTDQLTLGVFELQQ